MAELTREEAREMIEKLAYFGISEENLEKAVAQYMYCQKRGIEQFVGVVGYCWHCDKQVYEEWDLESAASTLVTGCPYCHRSFIG